MTTEHMLKRIETRSFVTCSVDDLMARGWRGNQSNQRNEERILNEREGVVYTLLYLGSDTYRFT